LKFVLDATFSPQLATALEALSQGEAHFEYAPTLFGSAAPDELIYHGVRDRGACLITLDIAMTRKPQQRAVMKDAGIGVFVFTGRALAQQSFNGIPATVLGGADEIAARAQSTRRPFVWGISDRKKFVRLDEGP